MPKQKILFICNQNENRSRTAEELFRDRFNTRSAGLYNEKPVTKKELDWADAIIVMEDQQRTEISKRFPEIYIKKKILSLNIPDIYDYKNPELINLLKSEINKVL